jgi:hypothetical protein
MLRKYTGFKPKIIQSKLPSNSIKIDLIWEYYAHDIVMIPLLQELLLQQQFNNVPVFSNYCFRHNI